MKLKRGVGGVLLSLPPRGPLGGPARAWVDRLTRFSDLPCLCDTDVIVRGGQRTGSPGVDGAGLGGQLNQCPYDGCCEGGDGSPEMHQQQGCAGQGCRRHRLFSDSSASFQSFTPPPAPPFLRLSDVLTAWGSALHLLACFAQLFEGTFDAFFLSHLSQSGWPT